MSEISGQPRACGNCFLFPPFLPEACERAPDQLRLIGRDKRNVLHVITNTLHYILLQVREPQCNVGPVCVSFLMLALLIHTVRVSYGILIALQKKSFPYVQGYIRLTLLRSGVYASHRAVCEDLNPFFLLLLLLF